MGIKAFADAPPHLFSWRQRMARTRVQAARKLGPYLTSLMVVAALAWIAAAIAPVSRSAWVLENILLFVGVGWLIATFRRWRLSDASYTLIFVFMLLHILGTHYTYSFAPPGAWLEAIFGGSRNGYDRLIHFLFGFLLFYPWRETCVLAMHGRQWRATLIAIMIIASISAAYEIAEWLVAQIVGPDDAIAYIGAQGDFFDSQKDMTLAIVGACVAAGIRRAFIATRNWRAVVRKHRLIDGG